MTQLSTAWQKATAFEHGPTNDQIFTQRASGYNLAHKLRRLPDDAYANRLKLANPVSSTHTGGTQILADSVANETKHDVAKDVSADRANQ
jgi:hypothetical protein